MSSNLLTLSLFLLARLVLSHYSYYALTQTLLLDNPFLNTYNFQLKFSKVDDPHLACMITLPSHTYKLYYFPLTSEVCIEHSELGSATVNVNYDAFDSINFTPAQVAFNGIVMHILASTFQEPIGQIRIIQTAAGLISSQLSQLLQLAEESCISKRQYDCTQCLPGYYLSNSPAVCQPLPYGCLQSDSTDVCKECRVGFVYDANLSRCHNDSDTFVRTNQFTNDLIIRTTPTLKDWTIQFYLKLLSSRVTHTIHQLLSVSQDTLTVNIDYEGNNSTNQALMSLFYKGKQSNKQIGFYLGEWILVSFYKNVNSKYTLLMPDQGVIEIDSFQPISLSQSFFNLKSNNLVLEMKELSIWNSYSNLIRDSSNLVEINQAAYVIDNVRYPTILNSTKILINCNFDTGLTNNVESCSLINDPIIGFRCSCKSMIRFLAQNNTSTQMNMDTHDNATGHNHESIIETLGRLNFSNLKNNIGFLFAVGYVSLFCFFLILVCLLDRKHYKSKFEDQLFEAVHQGKDNDQKTNQSSVLHGLHDHNNSNLILSVSSNPAAIHPLTNDSSTSKGRSEIILKNYKEQDLTIQISDGISFTPSDQKKKAQVNTKKKHSFKRRKSKFAQIMDSEAKAILPKRRFSPVDKIKRRLNKIILDPKISKSCCCVFQKLAQNELSTNNQMYNLFASYNPLNRRTTRIMFCYAAILLEFVACAVFCYIGYSAGNNAHTLQEQILFNFIIALFSTLLTIGPLIIIGCFCSFPAKWMKRLKATESPEEMKQLYLTYEKRIKCRLVTNVILFATITFFELLFIICFCHVADHKVAKEWFFSSCLSILLDIVVFEIVAALGFACCGIMKKYCRGCEGIIWLIIIVEMYRIYRNLVLG